MTKVTAANGTRALVAAVAGDFYDGLGVLRQLGAMPDPPNSV
jgi:hypothetical protein